MLFKYEAQNKPALSEQIDGTWHSAFFFSGTFLKDVRLKLCVAAVITHVDWSAVNIPAALLLPWP